MTNESIYRALSDVYRTFVHPKLLWVEELSRTFSAALGSSVTVFVIDHIDPLKKLVVYHLDEDLKKGDYNPIQKLAHGFAKANGVVLERIRREPKRLILEVLLKNRLAAVLDPPSKNNPLD